MRVLNKKKREAILVILLILLSLSIRLPTTPHIVFHDSYVNLWKTNKIKSTGYVVDDSGRRLLAGCSQVETLVLSAINVFDSVDYFRDLYPFTPPIQPVSLAYYSLLSGMNTEHAALFYSLLFGVLGCLGAFFLSSELTGDRVVRVLTAFFYSTAPVFVSMTSWTFISRGSVTSLLPFLFLFFLRYYCTRKRSYLFSCFIVGVFLLFTHKIGVVFFIALLAYFFSLIFTSYFRVRRRLWGRVSRIAPYFFMVFLVLLVLLPFFLKTRFFASGLWDYRQGYFMSGAKKSVIFFNMVVDYYSSLGLLGLFAVVGFVEFSFRLKSLKFADFFIAFSLILLAPFFIFGEYMTLLVILYSSFLISIGLRKVFGFVGRWPRPYTGFLLQALTTVSIISSVLFTLFMVNHWNTKTMVPSFLMNQWADERIVSMVEYANALQHRVAVPDYFKYMLPYMAAYLNDDEKIFYISDIPYLNLTHAPKVQYFVSSEDIMGLWNSTFPKPKHILNGNCEIGDKVYSNGFVSVLDTHSTSVSFAKSDLSSAFIGPETVVGIADGSFYVMTSDGRVIEPLIKHIGCGINSITLGDFTSRRPSDIVVGLANGTVLLLNNAGQLIWSYAFADARISSVAVANVSGGMYNDVLVETSDNKTFVLNSSGSLIGFYNPY